MRLRPLKPTRRGKVHLCEDVRKVKPLDATGGHLVRILLASPTCTHFSRASGARLSPETIKIRGLAWMVMPWIVETRPETIIVENVIEFLQWGPVCWQHHEGCCGDASGERCIDECGYGRPIRSRAGETFRAWKRRIESFGYSVETRVIEAWELGAPTMRKRAYVVCRSNGKPYRWPKATHVRPDLVESTGKKPWRTAAQIIDWSIPCPSIFDRVKPHVPATRRRLAKGMVKYVLEAERPFLMPVKSWGGGGNEPRSIDLPTRTTTASKRGEFALAVPYMVHRGNGERPGQEPRTYDVANPYPTVVAGGCKAQPVVAFLAKAYSERVTGGWNGGAELDRPIGAITAQDHHYLVAAHTVKFYGTSVGHDLDEPLATVTGGGWKHGVVAASVLRYNGERRAGEAARGNSLNEPISTLDASNRFALLEAELAVEWNDIIAAKARRVYRFMRAEGYDGPWMDHEHELVVIPSSGLVVYDIGMRMLAPRELFRANGFHDSYVIELRKPNGKPLTKTEQVRLVGNSVCPDVAEALVRAALGMRRRREPVTSTQLGLWKAAA